MCIRHASPRTVAATAVLGAMGFLVAGCDGRASPTLPMFGAYFPFWLICSAVGVLGAVVLRVAFVRFGIDEGMPWRLLVYSCLAAAIGFVVALALYGR